ncbi:MAG: tetratricopeptide repeat protein [Candidatus Auribacterota bacterium]|nr:tetratricopeptide repeat protein [Candidatus Auribacterota bacterium]
MRKIPASLNLQPGEEARLWEEISDAPERISRYRKLSRLLAKRNRPREAIIPLRLALKKMTPDKFREIRDIGKRIARLHSDAGDTGLAIRAYRRLIREYPDVAVLYERLEKIYRHAEQGEKMVEILKGVAKDNPKREHLLKRLVRLETRLGKLNEARNDLKLMINEFGSDFRRLKDLGRLYSKTGNIKLAIESYEKAMKFKPENADLALLIGVSLRQVGQRDKARKVFQDTLNFKPGWYGSYINLAEMDIEDGDFASAENHFKKIDSSFPGNSRVMINRADILLKEDRPEEALAICREGAAATAFYYTDELSLGHRVLADAYATLGNKDEARYHRLMAKRIKGSSDFFTTTIEVADEEIAAGDLDLAEKIADGLLSRFPMNSLAYVKKAEIARIRGLVDDAISFAERAAREENPKYLNDKIKGLELLAELYQEKGEPETSKKYSRQARELTAG